MSARSRAHTELRRALLVAKSAAGKARATTNQGTPSHKRSQQMLEMLIALCNAHTANDHARIDQLHSRISDTRRD